jgi:hypothetical protein
MTKLWNLGLAVSMMGLGSVACGGSQPPPVEPAKPSEVAPPAPEGETRPTVSAQQCEASGGTVVGDIGDGAIHRPDYRCASGAKPTASISNPEGGPIAIEGSVCCPR